MDVVDDAVKELLDALTGLGGGLAKTQAFLSSLGDPILPRNNSFLLEIGLVSYQNADSISLAVLPEQFEPDVDPLESLFFGHIVHKDGTVCVLDVVGDETLELFLTGSVPKLQAIDGAVVMDIFYKEVNADGLLV